MKEVTIVGLPYYNYQKVKNRLVLGSSLWLVHEPDNVHSNTAIRVEYEGTKIGYVSGRESESLLKELRKNTVNEKVLAVLSDTRTSCIKATIPDCYIKSAAGLIGTTGPVQPITAKLDPKQIFSPTKEETMMDKIVNTNKQMAKSAAYLEAGRIANKAATKAIASRAPLMVRGYVETAFGKLVIANLAAIAADKVRPGDTRLAKLANAMITEAYQEVYQEFDIEKMLMGMLENETVKAALNKLDSVDSDE